MALQIAYQKLNFLQGVNVKPSVSQTRFSRSTSRSTGMQSLREDAALGKKNMKVFMSLIAMKVVKAHQSIGADLLGHAQPRVPYDTGQLRESGTVTTIVNGKEFISSKGNKDGYIETNFITPKASELHGSRRIETIVSYARSNMQGENIAYWCHEVLRPQDERVSKEKGSGISYAKKVGTGPKYLEIPFLERKNRYLAFATNLVSPPELAKDIALISEVRKARSEKHTVDRIELIQSKVANVGYFGSLGM